MTGLYIVILDGAIYGIYNNDTAAKECQTYVATQANKMPQIRYYILNKNYWENEYTKYNELYDFGTQL